MKIFFCCIALFSFIGCGTNVEPAQEPLPSSKTLQENPDPHTLDDWVMDLQRDIERVDDEETRKLFYASLEKIDLSHYPEHVSEPPSELQGLWDLVILTVDGVD